MMKKLIEIDPYSLGDTRLLNLFTKLIHARPQREAFIKNKRYSVGKNKLSFTHTVLCKVDEQNKPFYQILSNKELVKAGGTDKTDVYLIEKTLRIAGDKCIYSEPSLPLIAKCQSIHTTDKSALKKRKRLMMHEYKESKEGHLAAEKPSFASFADRSSYPLVSSAVRSKKNSGRLPCPLVSSAVRNKKNSGRSSYRFFGAAVQRKMPGIELFDLISYFTIGVYEVTFHLRLMLIFQLLDAFNAEVLQKRKVHGDLKSENIMVDLGHHNVKELITSGSLEDKNFNPTWPMHVIDFEGAYDFNVARPILSCTRRYLAPEIIDALSKEAIRPPASDEKEDMFGIAKIIALILGLIPDETAKLADVSFREEKIKAAKPFYPDESAAFSIQILSCIFAVFSNLVDPNPSTRWSFNQVYDFFKEIQTKYNQMNQVKTIENSEQVVGNEASNRLEDRNEHIENTYSKITF